MIKFPFLACLAVSCGFNSDVIAGETKFQSHEGQHTSLVELYTSEGCSSCPPAESWLSRLTASPQLWSKVVPLAFHVDYWDGLGWRDRFAAPAWTARQRAYAAGWGNQSVYTPGLVLDGAEWRDWSSYQPGAIPATAGSAKGTGQLEVFVKGEKTVTVVYRPAERVTAEREVFIALLGCDLKSDVKAGENRGRALRHDFVVLACEMRKLAVEKTGDTAVIDLPRPAVDAGRLALAAWVSEPGRASVEQATGGWLRDAAGTEPPH